MKRPVVKIPLEFLDERLQKAYLQGRKDEARENAKRAQKIMKKLGI